MKNHVKDFMRFSLSEQTGTNEKYAEMRMSFFKEASQALKTNEDAFFFFTEDEDEIMGFCFGERAAEHKLKELIMEIYGEEAEDQWREEVTESGEDPGEMIFDPSLWDMQDMGYDILCVRFNMATWQMWRWPSEDEAEQDQQEEIERFIGDRDQFNEWVARALRTSDLFKR